MLPNNNKENENQKKPAYSFFLHVSELNYNSKKAPKAFQLERNFKDIKAFDVKHENIIGVDFSTSNNAILNDNKQFKDKNVINKILSNLEIAKSMSNNQAFNQSLINKSMNTVNSNNNNYMRQQNKKILEKKKPKKKRNQLNKNQKKPQKSRNYSSNANFNLISKKNKQKIQSKKSESSDNSTKRNDLLRTHNSPEKYPEDYWSVDSSSDEEKELKKKEIQINQNGKSLFFKELLETGKILNPAFNYKKKVESHLEGFDINSIDAKSVFRDTNFKKKYFHNFKANIKIVYFDKESFPLQAIFLIDNEKYLNQREKKIFPGAFSKEEFIEFCDDMIKKNKSAKVELLLDFAEMTINPELGIDINMNYFDFYFLVEIFDEDEI